MVSVLSDWGPWGTMWPHSHWDSPSCLVHLSAECNSVNTAKECSHFQQDLLEQDFILHIKDKASLPQCPEGKNKQKLPEQRQGSGHKQLERDVPQEAALLRNPHNSNTGWRTCVHQISTPGKENISEHSLYLSHKQSSLFHQILTLILSIMCNTQVSYITSPRQPAISTTRMKSVYQN